jgi:hypothetical protein
MSEFKEITLDRDEPVRDELARLNPGDQVEVYLRLSSHSTILLGRAARERLCPGCYHYRLTIESDDQSLLDSPLLREPILGPIRAVEAILERFLTQAMASHTTKKAIEAIFKQIWPEDVPDAP